MEIQEKTDGIDWLRSPAHLHRRSNFRGSELLILNGRDRTRTCDLLRVKRVIARFYWPHEPPLRRFRRTAGRLSQRNHSADSSRRWRQEPRGGLVANGVVGVPCCQSRHSLLPEILSLGDRWIHARWTSTWPKPENVLGPLAPKQGTNFHRLPRLAAISMITSKSVGISIIEFCSTGTRL